MKSLRLSRWSGCVLSPRTRPCYIQSQCQLRLSPFAVLRNQSTVSAQLHQSEDSADDIAPSNQVATEADQGSIEAQGQEERTRSLRNLPSPPPYLASKSAKLSALHARITLPPRLPLETLARCLIDPTADLNPHFNNHSLSVLGSDLLGYYTSEAVMCRYPRLPTEITYAAVEAYVGRRTLALLTREWGVEMAAAPGGEVDPGLLQFTRSKDPLSADSSIRSSDTEQKSWQRGVSSKTTSSLTISNNPFGDETKTNNFDHKTSYQDPEDHRTLAQGIDPDSASAGFVRALFGALYLHAGLRTTKAFFSSHIMSRHLNVSALFNFRQPTRDVSRLCAREGFESPTARILSETGRRSRHPVFNVGIFSGREKLGEGSGGSLDEARIRAAIATLKGWYLYSPVRVRVPSEMLGGAGKQWEPLLVDCGEVIV